MLAIVRGRTSFQFGLGRCWASTIETTMTSEKGKPTIYVDDRSPPVRSVLMLLDELQIDAHLVEVDLFKREQFAVDYLKVSPQHTVPALQHGDFTLTDSHAILLYLAQHFGKSANLLPVPGSQEWFVVVDRLLFNASSLFRRDSDAFSEIFATQPKDISGHCVRLGKQFDVLEAYLSRSKFIAGDKLSIADLSTVCTVSTINLIRPVDASKWPRLAEWFESMRQRPSYERRNLPGLRRLRSVIESLGVAYDLTSE